MTSPLKNISKIKDTLKSIIEDLSYCIDVNVTDEDEDNSGMSPLLIPLRLNTVKEKYVALLQKIAKSISDLITALETLARSNMIHTTRTLCDLITTLVQDSNQVTMAMPEGKAKLKFLEAVSKCKSLSLQLKINISVRASSSEDDDVTDLDGKILGLFENIAENYNIVTHSDRVFTDMDFQIAAKNKSNDPFGNPSSSGNSNWNTINWN